MASFKDTFEPKTFAANSFACGTWRGNTPLVAGARFVFELIGPNLTYSLNGPPLTYTVSGPEVSYTLIGPDPTEEINEPPFQPYELQ